MQKTFINDGGTRKILRARSGSISPYLHCIKQLVNPGLCCYCSCLQVEVFNPTVFNPLSFFVFLNFSWFFFLGGSGWKLASWGWAVGLESVFFFHLIVSFRGLILWGDWLGNGCIEGSPCYPRWGQSWMPGIVFWRGWWWWGFKSESSCFCFILSHLKVVKIRQIIIIIITIICI